jgi:hypothetical protein
MMAAEGVRAMKSCRAYLPQAPRSVTEDGPTAPHPRPPPRREPFEQLFRWPIVSSLLMLQNGKWQQ